MRKSRFSHLKQYCESKAAEGDNAYLFVLGWADSCESARQVLKEQIEHHTRMQQKCQQQESIEMHKRHVAAAQDVLKRIGS